MIVKLRELSLNELPPLLLACAGILGIGPMAVYRLLEGNFVVAIVDAIAVTGFATIAWLVYVKKSVRIASVCMALIAIVTAVITVNIRGDDQVIWMHPATVALFYLLKPKEAVAVALAAIVAVLPVIFNGRPGGESAVVLSSLAVTISLSVAFAALTSEQRRELRAISLVDALTDTGNRRALDLMLDTSIRDASAQGQSFYLIMLDIDHFKSVNDRYGHATGDAVLCEVADTIKANIRPSDSCFRAGGEEFVIVAAASEIDQIESLAERLRVAIAELKHTTSDGAVELSVTASLGLAGYLDGESRDTLYRRADDALYEAKRKGRNRLQMSKRLARASVA